MHPLTSPFVPCFCIDKGGPIRALCNGIFFRRDILPVISLNCENLNACITPALMFTVLLYVRAHKNGRVEIPPSRAISTTIENKVLSDLRLNDFFLKHKIYVLVHDGR